ncbi:ArsR family transcriptional regulator [Streptomyces sp. NPDC050546]|uniref:ArsR/SmtB family transcription factor n=1 Tax=Streptomyces sp. NPDC050546 TaxID=3365628 RepID=UPI0037AC860A
MVFLLGLGRTADGAGLRIERSAAREVLFRKDLHLLMALRRETRTYAPGFLFAHRDLYGSLDAELHQLASTPSAVVARQMDRFLKRGQYGRPSRASADTRTITAALEAGERSFVERVASELAQYWLAFLADRWDVTQSRIEADIRHRAASMARRGLSATLNSLHPAVSYDSGALHIRDERSWKVCESTRIVLHPSPLVSTWLLRDDPWGEDGTHLAYPIGPNGAESGLPVEEPAADALGKVIGEARLLLLSDLGSARTTTELAERHRMSASTVSYHLLRLHRVGLLNRTREGSRVYYQRTPEADRLVARRDRRTLTRQFADA